jgi:hypothetical protein
MAIDAAYSPENPSKCGPYTDNKGNDFYGIPYEVNTLDANIGPRSEIPATPNSNG